MAKVFLSHSSFDKEYVEQIANKFGKDKAVYDKFSFETGEKTFEQILDALNNTDLFVIFLSDQALESKWVKEELNIAIENVNLGKIKQIFPIIIDSKISYQDKRIPMWMTQGIDSLNLKPIESPLVAYRKINTKLNELHSNFKDTNVSYVGHEKELLDFQNRYFSDSSSPLTCIIAAGFQGIGRTSFIQQCLLKTNEFKKTYSPILIDFTKNQSIEDLICKLVEAGYGKEDIISLNKLDFDSKINILITQLKQIQDFKEFVIFKDEGGLIVNQDIIWWLNKAITQIRPELTFGIVSKHHVNSFKLTNANKIFCVDINELDNSNKLRLLQQYAGLDRDDAIFFSGCVTGHPVHIKYCARLIEEYGLEETKSKRTHLLTEFSFQNAIKIIDSALETLSYNTEEQRAVFMGYLAFLATYPNVPVSLVLKVNELNENYESIYHNLISLCICQKIGVTKDIISTSPLICDYFDRNRIKKAKEIEELLNTEFSKFKRDMAAANLDEYCYSQLDFNFKTLIIDEKNFNFDYKYLYPSVIVRAIIELYNTQKYARVLELCATTYKDSRFWDLPLLNTFYYYYCMALAHKRDNKVLTIAHEKINGESILDSNQINFVIGFYYKFISKYDSALSKFKECISSAPNYITARRELVEVYTTLEDYDAAMMYAKKNYLDYPENPFNIFQYFKCCVHQSFPDKTLLETLLVKLEAYEKSISNSRKFYPEAKTLYYKLVEKDIDKAIEFLTENYYNFDNKIYYYKNLFDLYEVKRDIVRMQFAYQELEQTIANEDTYAPILLRRKFTLMYFNGQRYDNIIAELNLSKVGEYAKKQIIKHLNYLFKI